MADWDDFQFEMVRGDDHTEEIVIESGDPLAAVDLSAYQEFWFTGRRYPGDTAAVFALTKTAGGITFKTTGTDGRLLVKIPKAATTPLPNWGQTLFADLQGKDAAGNIGTSARGTIQMGAESTLATS